jgi:urease accessory protein
MQTAARTPTSTDEALLDAARDARGRTVLRTLRGCTPFGLRELRAPGAAARVAIVQTAACLLSGDETRLRVRVGVGAAVVLSDISALLAHPVADGPEAVQRIVLEVAEGGRLVFAEQPLIVAAGARLRRELRIALAPGATLLHRDTLVLGRHGEQPGAVTARLRVTRAGTPLLDETLTTADLAAARSPAVLGSATAIGAVSLFGAAPSSSADAAAPASATAPPLPLAPGAAVFQLTPTDTTVRQLAPDVRALAPLDALLRRWATTLDQDPPRCAP